jgi:hypothetical protein
VPGIRYLDKSVYILTSSSTFSGAEQFAYDLQALKRAQIVGEVTGGGANPGAVDRIDDNFGVFIPVGQTINPVTKTNWEGVGVQPDVATTADLSLKIAQLTALQKLVSDGRDRPSQEMAEMKNTIASLQRDIAAQNIINAQCPPGQAPAVTAVTDANSRDNIVASGTMIVSGVGFSAGGGNSIRLTQSGVGSVQLNESSGLSFSDRSSNQITAALSGKLTPGPVALVVNNACGLSSAPFPVTIH